MKAKKKKGKRDVGFSGNAESKPTHSSGKRRDEENKVTTSKFPTLVFNIVRPMWQEGPIWYNHIVTVNPKRKNYRCNYTPLFWSLGD